jgi:O-antigen/teichoic acid export membrane protein
VSLAANILSTLAARAALLGLALVSSILLARLLGPEGRGLFALVLLLPELVRTFALLGFDQAHVVYAGLEPPGRRALAWHSVVLAGGVGGLAAAAASAWLALGAPGFTALVQGPLWLYLLPVGTLPGLLLLDYWASIIRGMNRIGLLNLFDLALKAASLVLVVLLVDLTGLGVAGAVMAQVITSVAGLVAVLILLRSLGVLGAPVFDRSLWRRSRAFALPAYCNTALGYLNYRADQFLIAAFLPRQQLAFYVIAVDLTERLWLLTGAAANALLPHLTNSTNRQPSTAAVVARHVLTWTAAASVAAFAFGGFIVELLYSKAYADATAPLRWLLPGIAVSTVGKVLVGELAAREKMRSLVSISATGAVVNTLANLALIPTLGISGAALASTVSYSLVSLLVIRYYLRETGVPWTTLVPRPSDALPYRRFVRRALTLALPARNAAG